MISSPKERHAYESQKPCCPSSKEGCHAAWDHHQTSKAQYHWYSKVMESFIRSAAHPEKEMKTKTHCPS